MNSYEEGLALLCGRSKMGVRGNASEFFLFFGIPHWTAPEIIQESRYDGKLDVWALGVSAIEMIEGFPPRSTVHPMRLWSIYATGNTVPISFLRATDISPIAFLSDTMLGGRQPDSS